MRKSFFPAFAVLLLSVATVFAAIPTNVTIRNYFGSLTFNRPVEIAAVPGFDSTFVVLEQWVNGSTTAGQITLVRSVAGTWTKSAFDTVTFSGAVTTTREMGLLSLAFHPNFAQNRKYYVGYTPSYNSATTPTGRYQVVERVTDSTFLKRDANVASKLLVSVTLTGNSQIGGALVFGPQDGYLYMGIGDGGGTGDPQNYAQNPDSLQGKILRINVDAADAGKPYAVPADNPFVGVSGKKPEVWAMGLRHPWRFGFHPVRTTELWAGELGTNIQDEISIVPKGGNMGWPIVEGTSCYPSTVTNCVKTGYTNPLYTRAAQVLIGGQFFMGQSSGQFNDTYIFGMWETGVVFGMRYTNGAIADQPVQIATVTNVSSLAKDNRGRILAARLGTTTAGNINANTGIVYVLESPDMMLSPATAVRPSASGRGNSRDPSITRSELALHRDAYEIKTLDGRVAAGIPAGIFWVSRKGSTGRAQLMSGVWE